MIRLIFLVGLLCWFSLVIKSCHPSHLAWRFVECRNLFPFPIDVKDGETILIEHILPGMTAKSASELSSFGRMVVTAVDSRSKKAVMRITWTAGMDGYDDGDTARFVMGLAKGVPQ